MSINWKAWQQWPSPVTELISGLAVVAVVWVAGPSSLLRLAVAAHIASLGYELVLDPNGWSAEDFMQRELGIIAGMVLWLVTH